MHWNWERYSRGRKPVNDAIRADGIEDIDFAVRLWQE
jgi:hypothetical protein